jgi:hypothetical protein
MKISAHFFSFASKPGTTNAHSWYSQMGAVAIAPASAETFNESVSGEVRLMLTKEVFASGCLAFSAAIA